MGEVKWIKVNIDAFKPGGSLNLIEAMPEGDSIIVIFFKLLLLAGSKNAGGLIFYEENIPYTEEMLAHVLQRPINTIKFALATLSKFRIIDILDDKQILMRNYEAYQNMEGLELIKEKNRLRQQKYREKHKLLITQNANNVTGVTRNVTVTQENKNIEVDTDKDTDNKEPPTPYSKIKELFLEICKSYPKIQEIEGKRKIAIRARWKKYKNLDKFKELFEKAEASDFMKGKNNKNWHANFDWMIKPSNMTKVLEGNYDNRDKRSAEITGEENNRTREEWAGNFRKL